MTIAVIVNGDGPTILLLAGNHSDEYEGQIALTKLVRELEPEDIRGQVILLAMANILAVEVGLRASSIDGGNLSRALPGDTRSGLTDMVANYIGHVLMPFADYMTDLHSGGSSLIDPSTTDRTGIGLWAVDFVATFRLVGTILTCLRARPDFVPMAVGLCITAAYCFTSSTSFANPPVTIARGFSDTFARINPANVLAFVGVQLVAATLATFFFGWFLEDDSAEAA